MRCPMTRSFPAGKSVLSRTRRMPRRSGAALLEFAIISPFLFTLILGIIDFGRVMLVEQILTNAAREGARDAVLPGGSKSNVRSVVTTYMTNSGVALTDPTNQV